MTRLTTRMIDIGLDDHILPLVAPEDLAMGDPVTEGTEIPEETNAGIKVDHALMKKVIATHATPEMLALSPEKFAEAVAGYDLGQSNDLYDSFVFAFRQLGRSDFDPANTASFVLDTCWWRDVKALLGITEVRRFVSEDHLNNIERVRQHHAI